MLLNLLNHFNPLHIFTTYLFLLCQFLYYLPINTLMAWISYWHCVPMNATYPIHPVMYNVYIYEGTCMHTCACAVWPPDALRQDTWLVYRLPDLILGQIMMKTFLSTDKIEVLKKARLCIFESILTVTSPAFLHLTRWTEARKLKKPAPFAMITHTKILVFSLEL